MRRAHERLLLLGGVLLALSLFLLAPFLMYVWILGIIASVCCLLLSWLCGMAYLWSLPAGSVGLRSHLSYFVVSACLAGFFASAYLLFNFPTFASLPLIVATTLALLCGMYVIPFALLQWTDERRWLRLRTAWLLLMAAVLLPVVLGVCQPTALIGAVEARWGLAVRLLLYLGHDVNQRDRSGQTPLMHAVTDANRSIARLLLAHHADPNAVDNRGGTALEIAMYRVAMSGDDVELLELLYAAGARIDRNALGKAIGQSRGETEWDRRQRRAVVDWLLAHGATVAGSGALEAAVKYADAALVQHLLRHTPIPEQLADLAESSDMGDLKLVILFLEHGAEPNRPDEDGIAPLHHAADKGNLRLVTLFLEHGADPDRPDQDGMAPLHHAVVSGRLTEAGQRTAIIDLLLAHGANLDARTTREARRSGTDPGDTALALAVRHKALALAEYLLEKGANVDPVNAGWTPLSHAVRNKNLPMVKLLVAHGADLTRDPALLNHALAWGWIEGLRYLLAQGVPRPKLNSQLWAAVGMENETAVRLLLEAGADACSPDEYGSHAIHWASDRVRALVEQACPR